VGSTVNRIGPYSYHPEPLEATVMASDMEFISIPEWGRRVGLSKDSAYKRPD
jgi:hypothetical protein